MGEDDADVHGSEDGGDESGCTGRRVVKKTKRAAPRRKNGNES